jgi:hypothetical protein
MNGEKDELSDTMYVFLRVIRSSRAQRRIIVKVFPRTGIFLDLET